MRWQLILAGLLLPALVATAQLKLEPFTSKACGFSVLMPGTPKEQVGKIKSASGDLDNTQYAVAASKAFWMVSVVDYPAGSANGKEDALLDGAVKSTVKGLQGKTLAEGKIILEDKYPGRKLEVEAEKVGLYRAHIFLVGDRVYQVVVRGPKDVVTSPDATKYLESFKLVK
jgi:hypothetical protein